MYLGTHGFYVREHIPTAGIHAGDPDWPHIRNGSFRFAEKVDGIARQTAIHPVFISSALPRAVPERCRNAQAVASESFAGIVRIGQCRLRPADRNGGKGCHLRQFFRPSVLQHPTEYCIHPAVFIGVVRYHICLRLECQRAWSNFRPQGRYRLRLVDRSWALAQRVGRLAFLKRRVEDIPATAKGYFWGQLLRFKYIVTLLEVGPERKIWVGPVPGHVLGRHAER